MTEKNGRKTLARALQRVTEDEIGLRPKLRTCYNIIDGAQPWPPGKTEERAAALFIAHEQQLRNSAEDRATHTTRETK